MIWKAKMWRGKRADYSRTVFFVVKGLIAYKNGSGYVVVDKLKGMK
jgi:hypothetical protein